jgi:hypothetical protein
MYCVDVSTQEVVGVAAYHVDTDEKMPILITTLGFRNDAGKNEWLRLRTLVAGLVLKHHLHAIAERLGRGRYVDMDLADRAQLALASELGFRPAPRIKGFRPGGLHLRQERKIRK